MWTAPVDKQFFDVANVGSADWIRGLHVCILDCIRLARSVAPISHELFVYAVCSFSDQGRDSLLALFAQRFSQQIEMADTRTILTAWAAV